jgi:hypothetical protein
LITGQRIIGLLSTPKYIPFSTGKDIGFVSNYVVGYFRCLSGDVSDKYPQTNQVMRDMAFSYRLVPEIVPYSAYDPSWVNFNDPAIRGNTNEILSRSNYWTYVRNLPNQPARSKAPLRWPGAAERKNRERTPRFIAPPQAEASCRRTRSVFRGNPRIAFISCSQKPTSKHREEFVQI